MSKTAAWLFSPCSPHPQLSRAPEPLWPPTTRRVKRCPWQTTGARAVVAHKAKPWVPERQDIIWIDCNPQSRQRNARHSPFFGALAPSLQWAHLFGTRRMTTATTARATPLLWWLVWPAAQKRALSAVSCATNPIVWLACSPASPHPMRKASDAVFDEVRLVLHQIRSGIGIQAWHLSRPKLLLIPLPKVRDTALNHLGSTHTV